MSTRRPEEDVILGCARRSLEGRELDALAELLDRELDWSWIADTSERHGTAVLTHRALTAHFPERVPGPVLTQLGTMAHVQSLRNHVLAESLAQLVPAFGEAGIRVLAFKGPVLAVGVYGDLGLRAFGDLDLLVHPRDYRRSGRLLEQLGYPPTRYWRWEAAFQRDLTVVDLHRAMTSPQFRVRLPFDRLWDRRQTVAVGEAPIPALGPEHLLITLCVQVAKDAWEDRVRLQKVCDVAELVRTEAALDWDDTLGDASRAGALGMLAFSLTLAASLLDAPVPDRVGARLNELPDAVAQARRTAETLFAPRSPSGRSTTEIVRFHARLRERRRDRLQPYLDLGHHVRRLGGALAPNEQDRAAVALPAGLGAGYYLVRAVRLVRRALRALRTRSSSRSRPSGRSEA